MPAQEMQHIMDLRKNIPSADSVYAIQRPSRDYGQVAFAVSRSRVKVFAVTLDANLSCAGETRNNKVNPEHASGSLKLLLTSHYHIITSELSKVP